jgi:glyoxylase-like metal-dependent hydrolase (beta-lactamase superfamily II)
MKQVLPGIYQITLTLSGFNPGSVNTYLIETPNGFTSIDTGWDSPPSLQSMQQQLAEIGAGFADIKQVILTHCHIDHMGLVVRLKQSYPVKLYLHEKEIELIKIRFTGGDNFLPLTDKFLQSHGFPAAELTPPEVQLPIPLNLSSIQPDVLLHGDEIIPVGQYNLRVVNTPGHTPGHIALYEPAKKFLFSGDMLLPTIATNAALHVQHIPYPLQKYLDSLRTLRQLDIETVLPGHEHVFFNAHKRIDELIRDHEQKSQKILKVFADGKPKTAYEVSRILAVSARTKTNVWATLTGWDQRFAVLQTIAHLETLRFNHKLDKEATNGIDYYRSF